MFGRLFESWALKKQAAEASDYLSRVESVDSEELGLTNLFVLHMAELAKDEFGWEMYEPASVLFQDNAATIHLSTIANELKRNGNMPAAGAMILWTHTVRATVNLKSRPIVRRIWSQVLTGAPYAEGMVPMFFKLQGEVPDMTNLGRYPSGFKPA